MLKQLVKNSLLFSLLTLMIGLGIIYVTKQLTTNTTNEQPIESTQRTVTSRKESQETTTIKEEIYSSPAPSNDTRSSGILQVPHIQQLPELERGCEVTSLAMILQFNGIAVDKMKLAAQITYEPFQENGLHGNMNQGFVGDMKSFDKSGLGVYVEPIIELAQKYVEPNRVINLSGKSMSTLYQAIDQGHPVWVITNSWFAKLPEEQFSTWQTAEGPMKVTYRQHSVVITNYDFDYVYVNDPLQDQKNIPLPRKDFEEAWIQMNKQAIYIAS